MTTASAFTVDKKNIAFIYLVVGKKLDEIIRGPPVANPKGLTEFKKHHKNSSQKRQER